MPVKTKADILARVQVADDQAKLTAIVTAGNYAALQASLFGPEGLFPGDEGSLNVSGTIADIKTAAADRLQELVPGIDLRAILPASGYGTAALSRRLAPPPPPPKPAHLVQYDAISQAIAAARSAAERDRAACSALLNGLDPDDDNDVAKQRFIDSQLQEINRVFGRIEAAERALPERATVDAGYNFDILTRQKEDAEAAAGSVHTCLIEAQRYSNLDLGDIRTQAERFVAEAAQSLGAVRMLQDLLLAIPDDAADPRRQQLIATGKARAPALMDDVQVLFEEIDRLNGEIQNNDGPLYGDPEELLGLLQAAKADLDLKLTEIQELQAAIANYHPPAPPPPRAVTPLALAKGRVHDAIEGAKRQLDAITQHINDIDAVLETLPLEVGKSDQRKKWKEQHDIAVAARDAVSTMLDAARVEQAKLAVPPPPPVPGAAAPDLAAIAAAAEAAVSTAAAEVTKAGNALTQVQRLSREPYIAQKAEAAEVRLTRAEAELQRLEGLKSTKSFDRFAFGSSGNAQKRREFQGLSEDVENAQKDVHAETHDLNKWRDALNVYQLEMETIQDADTKIAELDVVVNTHQAIVTAGTAGGHAKAVVDNAQKQVDAATKEKNAVIATRLAAVNAIEVLERSLENAPALQGAPTLTMQRGGELGFQAQVVKVANLSDAQQKMLHLGDDDSRVAATYGGAEVETYFMNVKVQNDEVIVATKTYTDVANHEAQASLIQDKKSVKDTSKANFNRDDNVEMAMQQARMLAANYKKGYPIILKGKDQAQIELVHASLLWLKQQSKATYSEGLSDMSHGMFPQRSDLSDMKIISKYPGPEKSNFHSQEHMERLFIKARIPELLEKNTSRDVLTHTMHQSKKELQDLKASDRALKRQGEPVKEAGHVHTIKPKGM